MAELYPLFFKPVYKDYLWGGRNLERFGRTPPDEGVIAESWEISGHQDGLTRVINGPYAGKTLPDLVDQLGEALLGSNNQWALRRNKFPLLVKLLDANKRLSVQVHPEDDYARKHEGDELGKTEMWVVLEAKPDAAIIYGLSKKASPEEFKQSVETGKLEPLLGKIHIKKGDHICVPSGTLHAILAGSVLIEIQQNSNTTYRVYDWDRVGKDGTPRELHLAKALDVIDFSQVDVSLPVPEPVANKSAYSCERLCENKYFVTDRIIMGAGTQYTGNCNGETMEIWGVIDGAAEIGGFPMKAIQFVLLPAKMGRFSIFSHQRTTLLRTFTAFS